MALSDPLVRFTGVQKTYDGSTLVVRDLNLEIQSGEFLSLLGPSGSGKTTTLMMLAGFESPTSGEILLAGKSITKTPPHKRNFGMVFQNYALFPHMSIADNVAYPLTVRNMGKSEREDKVKRALDMVHLADKGDRYPGQLSGGQQQRVALARALVFNPQLVLMDEPLGALDKQLREHMQIELKELHRKLGLTFVYVTHDQSEALTMSDRVAVFNDGLIQQIDSVTTLYETPVNRFVASFVGDNTVLDAQITTTERGAGGICKVRLPCGTELQAQDINGAPLNYPVQACIRPERALISPGTEPAPANSLRAQVNDVIYYGDHLRMRCQVDKQAPATVKISLSSPNLPHAGDAIWLVLPPEHLRVYA
ncbi:MAG: ABC transporter ATP-binding protein [Rhodoferax sp.]|uniref:ABC transporter ATP-binding protein n=1 Tax=Rhodoferax sp. TaxID=50421 RepID=UPI002605D325|nr:ABC transporter ATP-binding protein [Rhodoferax sp.]MDD2882907.1 ABC transporter ATP-binding protein [Rhodoferax sp.]